MTLNTELWNGQAPVAGGYEIERSLRFNSGDSAFLSRTPASAGNRKTWTWSGWVKKGAIGQNQGIFNASVSTGEYALLSFNSSDQIKFEDVLGTVNGIFVTTSVYRDPGAWYHVVAVLDSTQSTASDRFKLYVNGVQAPGTQTTAFGSNFDGQINNSTEHRIGRWITTFNYYLDAYLADVHFVDGQALSPSDFAETDATTGQWVPKAYSGSYGTNGFHLTFSDNSGTSSTTLGKDAAGSNNWTPNNFSVASGPGNDSLVDVPRNGDETDTGVGGEVRGNYATLNPLDKNSSATLTNGNLDYDAAAGAWRPVRATTGIAGSGKWYWEVLIGPTAAVLGIETQSTSLANDYYPGIDATGYGYIQTGVTYNNGSSTSYGNSFTSGDLIGVAFDADNGKIWFSKNGTWQNSGNPATGTNAAYTGISTSLTYFPTLAFNGSGTSSINFGQRAFAYSAPSGFKALCTANLDDPTIADGSAYMDVVTYTGNGSTNTISGLGFSPDFVWTKPRTNAGWHFLSDIIRGGTKVLASNDTSSEITRPNHIQSWNSDGFTLGADGTSNDLNTPAVAWTWDAGSSTVSNTDGSITSQVRANASAGFSIATWSYTSGDQSFGHGLGVTPAFVVSKATSSTSQWIAYHSAIGTGKYLYLSLTDAAASNIANVFTGTNNSVFAFKSGLLPTSRDYVSYCFAPVKDYSAFGSYTGNGSSDGPFVYTGFRPRWLMVKNTTTASTNWRITDSARDTFNDGSGAYWLKANASAAEVDERPVDFLSNGFKLRVTDPGDLNKSSDTYIYAAFAENPFKYARAR